jgi:hypothetical protein
MQMFRYVTDAEAATEKKRREDELQQKADARSAAAQMPTDTTPKPAATPAQKLVVPPAAKPADPAAQKSAGSPPN